MKFTIVTPSLNQLAFLKRNLASVRDQGEVEREHLVQDGGSTDGTAAWLAGRPEVAWRGEPDEGMYDAINRGFARGSGEILSWLNCDEQYLPGALEKVAAYFAAHPEVDLAFGHTVVVNPEGEYLCHRKAVVPGIAILKLAILPVHSSSMFFRRRLADEKGLFDTQWKAIGDWDWVRRVAEGGARMGLLDEFLSSFTDTGANLDLGEVAVREKARARAMTPRRLRIVRPLVRVAEYGRKLRAGHYRQAPFAYEVYPPGEPLARRRFEVTNPTFYWKGRMLPV